LPVVERASRADLRRVDLVAEDAVRARLHAGGERGRIDARHRRKDGVAAILVIGIERRRDRITITDGSIRAGWEDHLLQLQPRERGGGSTLRYMAISPRFHESDFRTRTLDAVGDDWPITYADLERYYTRVEYELGVSGAALNPFDPPRSKPYPTRLHPLNAARQAVKRRPSRQGRVPRRVAVRADARWKRPCQKAA
jgi:choline dehydrogenase-like flavoprotein